MAIKSYIKHMSDMSGESKKNNASVNTADDYVLQMQQYKAQRDKNAASSANGGTVAGSSGQGGGTGGGSGGGAGKDSLPGIGNDTTGKTPYDEVLEILKGGGNYDNSYWAKPQNELLSNSRYAKSRDAEDRKSYLNLINDYKNTNPYETEWGKALLSQYGLDGDVAAKNEWADAAASNGGNIDSFAEANARRQRLSYLNSGVNAVNEASTQRFSNMIGALEKMGVNTQQLLGISTSNAQSAMDAAKNRYSDDTTATVAYNNMVQNVLPTILAEKYNTGTAAITPEVSGNIGNALQDAYDKGGEQGLLSAGAMIVNQYGQSYPDIEDIVKRYTDIISGSGGNTYYSGGTESSDNKDKHTVYDRGILSFLAGGEDRYKQLSETERERFEKLAKGYGYDSVYEWARDARDGKTYVPDWIKYRENGK